MINFERADPRLLDGLGAIVRALRVQCEINPDHILVVGAGCRDIMHSALGHQFPLRATSDTDLGIVVADWTTFELIDRRFQRIGDTGIRYRVETLPVDIMPFGGVEDPAGITRPAARGETLVVFGFGDVYAAASLLVLPGGEVIRVPSIAGYAALKVRSWIDRSVYGEDKDARDLALVAYWYQESAEVIGRLYDSPQGLEVLERWEWDVPVAAAQLLGGDVRELLSPENHADLVARWQVSDTDRLAQSFVLPVGAQANYRLAQRTNNVAAFIVGLFGDLAE